MASKNQGRVGRGWRYKVDEDCLPRHNYATGAGYKTKCRRPMRFTYTNAKLRRVSR